MPTGNGNSRAFIRTIFWVLLLGAYGYVTLISDKVFNIYNVHCQAQAAEEKSLSQEMVTRDEKIQGLVLSEIKGVSNKIDDMNTRLGKIEGKIDRIR